MTVVDKTERQDATSRWNELAPCWLAAHIKGAYPFPPKAKCPEQEQKRDSRPLRFSRLCQVLGSGLNTLGQYLNYSSQP